MKKKLLAIALFSIVSVSGFSILPPLAEGIRELSAIICNDEFYKNLGSGDLIEGIQKNEKGYLITTNKRTMQVDVIYLIQELIGPQKFKLEFHAPKSLKINDLPINN